MSIVNDLRLIPNFLKVDNSGSAVFSGSLIITNGITGSISATNSLISSSIQLTSSFDTRYVLSGSITQTTWDNIASKPGGIISSSAQLPNGLISGSSQLPSGIVSGSSQLPSGLISGSSQLPIGLVSGSSQITLSSTTGFTAYSASINNALTESKVTHIVSASGGLFYIDGASKPSMSFVPGITYRFDTTIIAGVHPFKFSLNANGPTEYTSGVTSGSNFIQIEVGYNTPEALFYYCAVHSGMGNTIDVLKKTTWFNIESKPSGIISGSSQLSGTTIENLTITNLTTVNETASVLFSSGSNRFGDFGNDSHQFTGSVSISGSFTNVGSVAFGSGTAIGGEYPSVAFYGSTANGNASFAHGNGTANGTAAYAHGVSTTANGNWSRAEGNSSTTNASAAASHAEGLSSTVGENGSYAHAEGESTLANARACHAEGKSTAAVEEYAHAEGIGTVASGSGQHVGGKYNLHGNTTSLFVIGNGVDTNNRSDIFRVNQTDVQITGSLKVTGDVVAYSTSDRNFKENITPIPNAIEKITKISGNTYDWKEENKDIHGFEGNDVGVIAQEIESVLPQLVTTRENGYKAVKYDKLVALLIEGIKEQQIKIDNLTIDVENLKKQKGL